jgi:hypothetical protein
MSLLYMVRRSCFLLDKLVLERLIMGKATSHFQSFFFFLSNTGERERAREMAISGHNIILT